MEYRLIEIKKTLQTETGLSLISRILKTEFYIIRDTVTLKLAYFLQSDRPCRTNVKKEPVQNVYTTIAIKHLEH